VPIGNSMLNHALIRALSVVVSTVAMLALPGATAAAERSEAIGVRPPSAALFRWMGSPSCSAQACHGDLKSDRMFPDILGNEHTIWIESDPHATARIVLRNETSKRIAARLRLGDAAQAPACLVCHAPQGAPSPRAPGVPYVDGVACEACHGGSEQWLVPHTQGGWRTESSEYKRRQGMLNTKDVAVRAAGCAACHVGSPGRDVNHDMIAAGHPVLRFEFGTFLSKIPKHWIEKGRDPGFEARVWAVGQAASAAAALDLLADRAAVATPLTEDAETELQTRSSIARPRPWPEFAEYDCFACHHDLQGDSWRQKAYRPADERTGPLGVPAWGTWYYALLPRFSEAAPVPEAEMPAMFDELNALMRSPAVDRNNVAAKASGAAHSLDDWARQLNSQSYDRAAIGRFFTSLTSDAPEVASTNWDGAAQTYLALVALRLAKSELAGPSSRDVAALRPHLRELYQKLRFRPSGDAAGRRRYDSPRHFDPDAVTELFEQIQECLKSTAAKP
jgi:hypothetical protein